MNAFNFLEILLLATVAINCEATTRSIPMGIKDALEWKFINNSLKTRGAPYPLQEVYSFVAQRNLHLPEDPEAKVILVRNAPSDEGSRKNARQAILRKGHELLIGSIDEEKFQAMLRRGSRAMATAVPHQQPRGIKLAVVAIVALALALLALRRLNHRSFPRKPAG